MRKNKGITLIALIITIIILVILTAVTLNNVIGSDLIGSATKGTENYIYAEKEEEEAIDKLVDAAENLGVSKDSKVKAGEIVTETVKDNYTDAEGRTATIPAGFQVSTKASEQYIKNGLVIQDEDGNEFVWVPCYVGEKPANAPSDLQEYKSHTYEEERTPEDDKGKHQNDSKDMKWDTYYYTIYKDCWKDTAATEYGNASVTKYGGFYIGRYEAGLPEDMQPNLSEKSPSYDSANKNNADGKKPISKANKFSWNYITQSNAKIASENMYKDNTTIYSKLVDGTAWDTTASWIGTPGITSLDCGIYGNYDNTNFDYTGWYAEIAYTRGKNWEEDAFRAYLAPKQFSYGTTKLQRSVLSNDVELWNAKKDSYVDSNKVDIKVNYVCTLIELPTGCQKEFKFKNIYDLAGNMWEMTTEEGKHEPLGNLDGEDFTVYRGRRLSRYW